MAFFGKSKNKDGKSKGPAPAIPPGQVLTLNWTKTPGGKFIRLIDLDPEETGLSGQGGIYVVWHAGIRPEWVYLGKTKDMGGAMHALARNQDVMRYDLLGGLYVTWVIIDEEYWDGALLFLNQKLNPVEDCPDVPTGDDVAPILVTPPGFVIPILKEE